MYIWLKDCVEKEIEGLLCWLPPLKTDIETNKKYIEFDSIYLYGPSARLLYVLERLIEKVTDERLVYDFIIEDGKYHFPDGSTLSIVTQEMRAGGKEIIKAIKLRKVLISAPNLASFKAVENFSHLPPKKRKIPKIKKWMIKLLMIYPKNDF